ncbi:NAD-dependent epimerase/dehydratase family protein [Photobacterium leiognathi]|uniref:NAD-dependent epimerase/dehydratase family protein n=1 Tax=Photobacterium leiognathi TaxID=553611 RepID=UPI001EDEDA40|nr:NAD-dependent epimerase/dehydratase family protein [Photobacterium leiognathi]MCG3886875.1 NAD-dependent epimerase/dehydratase family protein [Photobacterium leiognathi]
MRKVLLTGATGFVGKAIEKKLLLNGDDVIPASRNPLKLNGIIFDLEKNFALTEQLTGIEVIIHTAARVHCMNDSKEDEQYYIDSNVTATVNLAKQAIQAGVKRFIFISSIKVNGESTTGRKPFSSLDIPSPEDAYGQSKHKAENALLDLAKTSDMEIVIIRPPLVYGPNVKANFASLMNLASKPILLPFGAVNNKRSLIFVENLADFVVHILEHPLAKNKVWCVSDDNDLSLSQLLSLLIKFGHSKAILVKVPPKLIVCLLTFLGRKNVADRLVGDLQVNILETKNILDWTPPFSVEESLHKTVLLSNRKKSYE